MAAYDARIGHADETDPVIVAAPDNAVPNRVVGVVMHIDAVLVGPGRPGKIHAHAAVRDQTVIRVEFHRVVGADESAAREGRAGAAWREIQDRSRPGAQGADNLEILAADQDRRSDIDPRKHRDAVSDQKSNGLNARGGVGDPHGPAQRTITRIRVAGDVDVPRRGRLRGSRDTASQQEKPDTFLSHLCLPLL